MMPNYEEMFFILYRAILEAMKLLKQEDISGAIVCLADAQMKSTEVFLTAIDEDFKFDTDIENELEYFQQL